MKTESQLKVISFIRELRFNNDLSQAGLADILGISYGMVGNIESTKYNHKYTISQLHKTMETFKIPFEQLFLNEEEINMSKRKVIDLLIIKITEYDR